MLVIRVAELKYGLHLTTNFVTCSDSSHFFFDPSVKKRTDKTHALMLWRLMCSDTISLLKCLRTLVSILVFMFGLSITFVMLGLQWEPAG